MRRHFLSITNFIILRSRSINIRCRNCCSDSLARHSLWLYHDRNIRILLWFLNLILQLRNLFRHSFDKLIIRWFYRVKLWNDIRNWWIILFHLPWLILLLQFRLFNHLKSLHNLIKLLTNFFDLWCILIGVTNQRLREGLVWVLWSIAWTLNVDRRLSIYLLKNCKLLNVICKRHLVIVVRHEHCSSFCITVVILLITVLFYSRTTFLRCHCLICHDIVVVQINHSILI